MKLRRLAEFDAEFMLEWMHDDDVIKYLNADFKSKTLCDCVAFIKASNQSEDDLHMAIANDENQYMGTVSLKHIDKVKLCAEFAITVRKCAMGKGFSKFAIRKIVEIAFEELGLCTVYLNVYSENAKAISCYEKCGFKNISFDEVKDLYGDREKPDEKYPLLWFRIDK